MTGWPGEPVIYEINTAVWLDERSRAAGRPLTLADVAPADWDAVTPSGEFELASTARSALIKLIPILGDER